MEEFKYSLRDLDEMIPWERDIYLHLLAENIKKKNEIRQQELKKLDKI